MFGGLRCCFGLPDFNLVEQLLGIGIVFEVISHWLKQIVDCKGYSGFKITGMESFRLEVGYKFFVCVVGFGSTMLGLHLDGQRTEGWENDRDAVVEDRVALDNAWGAETFLDLSFDVLSGVFHENSRVWVTLAHLLLTFLETCEHVMGNDNGLIGLFDLVAILFGKDVDLSLVETKLANICLQEEDVCALHAWVQDL